MDWREYAFCNCPNHCTYVLHHAGGNDYDSYPAGEPVSDFRPAPPDAPARQPAARPRYSDRGADGIDRLVSAGGDVHAVYAAGAARSGVRLDRAGGARGRFRRGISAQAEDRTAEAVFVDAARSASGNRGRADQSGGGAAAYADFHIALSGVRRGGIFRAAGGADHAPHRRSNQRALLQRRAKEAGGASRYSQNRDHGQLWQNAGQDDSQKHSFRKIPRAGDAAQLFGGDGHIPRDQRTIEARSSGVYRGNGRAASRGDSRNDPSGQPRYRRDHGNR